MEVLIFHDFMLSIILYFSVPFFINLSDDWTTVDIHVPVQGETTHSYIFGGLDPYTKYDMRLRGVISDTGQHVVGTFTDILTITTGMACECLSYIRFKTTQVDTLGGLWVKMPSQYIKRVYFKCG